MKSRRLVAILVSVGIAGLCGCEDNKQTITSQRQANWSRADPSALSAAQPEPAPEILPQTHFAAGQLFEQQGAVNKAIAQYQEAIAGDPGHVAAWNRLGVLNARTGRHQEAEDALLNAVELHPELAPLRNNLGFEYVLQRRWIDAEAEFRNALALKPDFNRARINLGLTLAKQDRFAEALTQFAAVVPEPDAYYNLGLIFRSEHRYRDAAGVFERVLEIDPNFVAARKQLQQIQPQLALANELEPTLNQDGWTALAQALTGTLPADQSADQSAQGASPAGTVEPAFQPVSVEPEAPVSPQPDADSPGLAGMRRSVKETTADGLSPAPAGESTNEPETTATPEGVWYGPNLRPALDPFAELLPLGSGEPFDLWAEPADQLIPWWTPP